MENQTFEELVFSSLLLDEGCDRASKDVIPQESEAFLFKNGPQPSYESALCIDFVGFDNTSHLNYLEQKFPYFDMGLVQDHFKNNSFTAHTPIEAREPVDVKIRIDNLNSIPRNKLDTNFSNQFDVPFKGKGFDMSQTINTSEQEGFKNEDKFRITRSTDGQLVIKVEDDAMDEDEDRRGPVPKNTLPFNPVLNHLAPLKVPNNTPEPTPNPSPSPTPVNTPDPIRKGQRWYPAEVQQLNILFTEGKSVAEIASILNRTEESVLFKITSERINNTDRRAGKKWTVDEEKRVREMFLEGNTVEEIAEEQGRTPLAIKARLAKLNINL